MPLLDGRFAAPGHYTEKDREKIPPKDFGDPKNRKFPIVVPQDVEDAARLIGKAENPEAVKKRIIRIARRKGPEFVARIPESWLDKKATDATGDQSGDNPSRECTCDLVYPPCPSYDQGREVECLSAGTCNCPYYTAAGTCSAKGAQNPQGKCTCQYARDISLVGDSVICDTVEPVTDGAAEGGPKRYKMTGGRANVFNENNRLYPAAVYREAVLDAKRRAQADRLDLAESPHPAALRDKNGRIIFDSRLENAVAKIYDVDFLPDGRSVIYFYPLDTPKGKALQAVLDARGRIGVSHRATGRMRPVTYQGRPAEVAESFYIHTWDFVMNPAHPEASDATPLTDSQVHELLHPPEPPPTRTKERDKPMKLISYAQYQALSPEDKKKYLEEHPEFQAVIDAVEKDLRPLKDELESYRRREEKEKERARAQAYIKDELAKLTRFPENTRRAIADALSDVEDLQTAKNELARQVSLADSLIADLKLSALGFNPPPAGGTVTVEFGSETPPWQAICDELCRAFDEFAYTARGFKPDESLRKYNRPVIDRILAHFDKQNARALTDSVQVIENLSDSITTAELLNQPTILRAILIQAFQDVVALQFVETQPFEGSIWRIPVETYTPPADGNEDIIVAEDAGVPEAKINLGWLSYAPTWRKIATRLTEEAVRNIGTGPLKYQAIARALYHITQHKARVIDLALMNEMIQAADEYGAVRVENETIAAANLTAWGSGWIGQLKCGGTDAAPNTNVPIVRPRTLVNLNAAGQQVTTTINDIFCTVNGVAKTRGKLVYNSDGSVTVSGGDYAVDFENGKVYFAASANVDPAATPARLPVITYSYVTNFVKFDLTVPSGVEPSHYYDRLLQLIDTQAAIMGGYPRFSPPNLAIMSLQAATVVANAQLFYKQASPKGTELINTGNTIAMRNGINYSKINTPWWAGDGRILLTQQGATKYGIQTPFEVEGPYPAYDANGRIIGSKIWYGKECSVICTPQVTDASGNIINPKNRTIKLIWPA
ncbi:MAG: hypothetical protein IMW94_01480 [Thermoanaerobacter sp.]|nr:hypothetical protein [Thermoanaerobacter sp.]